MTSSATTSNNWRTYVSNFYSIQSSSTPGCINLSPAWMQGHLVSHTSCSATSIPTLIGTKISSHPQVSATLKEVEGWSFSLGLWADQNKSNEIGDRLREWPSVFTALAIVCNQCLPMHRDSLSRPQ
ncbi:hypothetical protein EDD22DRAFT_786437 [Suillus occidentalis]|nr:hypothetical protein EDD22DRAFT_786437 [Suillus occidentalis]